MRITITRKNETLNRILRNETYNVKIRIKYEIAFYLSKIMFTIQHLPYVKAHGHLTSHNIFIKLTKQNSKRFKIKVRLGDLECSDIMLYSNMFYDYRISSVWSAPEVLKTPKKMQTVTEEMDIYSFGLVLWELWHPDVAL